MAPHRNREEAVNTMLAILISKLGVTADAETIHIHGKHRPDVLFEMRGLPFLSRSAPTIAKVKRKLGWWCASTRKSRSFKRDIAIKR